MVTKARSLGMPAVRRKALVQTVAFELYASVIGADVVEARSRAQWVRATWERDAHRHPYYEALAERVIELLEQGDAAAPKPEGGIAALRLGLGVVACEKRTKRT